MLTENLPEVSKMHLLEYCCYEVLGHSVLKLSEPLKLELSKKIEVDSLFDTKMGEFIPKL